MTLASCDVLSHTAETVAEKWRLPTLFMLTLVYIISGKLSMILTIEPGFASAMFMPAGIAMAAVLISGYNTLPWIFLGAVLSTTWNAGVLHAPINVAVISTVLLMSLAATTQAAVGGAVLRSVLGRAIWMDHGKPLVLFSIVTPMACTVGAGLSVATLYFMGVVPREIVFSSWVIWWLGDSLAALILVPLILMLCGEPRQLWRSRLTTVGIPMMSGLLLFIVIFLRFSSWEKEQSLLEFNRLSQQVADRIQTRLEGQEVLLQQAETFLSSDDAVTRESFKERVGKIFTRYPSVMAVEWAPRVRAVERKAYEARNNLIIRERTADQKKLISAPNRDVYYPVTYIEPRDGNEEVLGFNMADQRVPLSALDASAASGHTLISSPTTLVQDRTSIGVHQGLLVIYPVRGGAHGPGFVAMVVRIDQFISNALPFLQGKLSVRLVDRDANVILYDSSGDKAKAKFEVALHFGGRDYLLQTMASSKYLQTHRAWQSWAILIAGLMFTALLGMALLLSTGHAARTEALVHVRTADLHDAKNFSETVINSLPGVFYMLDKNGRLVHWNRNFGRVFGLGNNNVQTEDVLKTIYSEDHAAIRAAIQRVYDTRGYGELEVRQHGTDGKVRHYLVNGQFIRISGEPYMFGTGLDLTEIQNAQARLRFANAELEKRVEEVRALQALLQEQAIRDPLSGLYNRRYLDEMLGRELAKAQREGYPVSIVLGDIDRFKDLNDTYGHQAGDEVIRLLSQLLREQSRAGDILCRFGGEEFILVLPGMSVSAAHARVDQWRELFARKRLSFGTFELSATISFGVAAYPMHGKTAERLIAVADKAMYIAKSKGRNCVESLPA